MGDDIYGDVGSDRSTRVQVGVGVGECRSRSTSRRRSSRGLRVGIEA